MPIYNVSQRSTGKTFRINAKTPKTQEEIQSIVNSYGVGSTEQQPKELNPIQKADVFVGKALEPIGKSLVPKQPIAKTGYEAVKDLASGFIPGGTPAFEGFMEKPPVRGVMGLASGMAFSPIGTLKGITGGAIGSKIGKRFGVPNIGGLLGGVASSGILGSKTKQLDSQIQNGLIKAIRPSIAGVKSKGQLYKKYNQQVDAVKEIAANKDAYTFRDRFGNEQTRTPRNLREALDALDVVKKKLYNEYDAQVLASGAKGKIDLSAIARKLNNEFSQKKYALMPELKEAALREASTLKRVGKVYAKDAQGMVETLNKQLEPFFKRGIYGTGRKPDIDAFIARNITKLIDDTIEKTGGGYKNIKARYGNLKALENDLIRRVGVDLGKNKASLIDFTDVYTLGQVARGIMGMNPSAIAQGIASKATASVIKRLNDPNRMIADVFKLAEKSQSIPQAPIIKYGGAGINLQPNVNR